MYYTVIKHDEHLRTRGKCKNTRRNIYSRMFTNVRRGLSQCITRLELLHLLDDIDFTGEKQ